MRGLIVDDEARGQRILKSLCDQYCSDLEIIGTADSVSDAKIQIKELKPDVVFLDIEMPVQNGFALLEAYNSSTPFQVIFTTAYDEYAVKAFKYTAVDYLLKPIEISDLQGAVSKARVALDKMTVVKPSESTKPSAKYTPDKIALPTQDGYTFVKIKDIIRCAAAGSYTRVFLKDHSSLLITRTLKHYEGVLADYDFFRVHKSHLINLQHIRKFIKGKKAFIELYDGQQIEVASRKRDALLRRLSSLD